MKTINVKYIWNATDHDSHIRSAKRILRRLLEADHFWINADEVTVGADFKVDFRLFLACIRALQPELVMLCTKDQA